MPDLFDLYEADTSSEFDSPSAPEAPKPGRDLFDMFEETGGVFDPEGDGYDYQTAERAGLAPDATGHWPSREPQSGQILKGRSHPTFNLTEQGEVEAGMQIAKGADGRYYSQPAAPAPAAARPQGDLFDQYDPDPNPVPRLSGTPSLREQHDISQSAGAEDSEAAMVLSLKPMLEAESADGSELQKMWDDVSLKKLATVGRRFGQELMNSVGDLAQAEIGQQIYLQDIYKDIYNPDNKYGRKYLENLKREAEETIARDTGIIESLPEVEDPAFKSVLGQMLEGGFTGTARFAPTMIGTMANPAIGYGLAVAQIAGAKRAELKKQGKSDELAWDAAIMEALPSAMVETASNVFQIKAAGRGLNKMAAKMGLGKKARAAIRFFLEGGTSEGLEEVTQDQWSYFTDAYVENVHRTPEEIASAAWQKIATMENVKSSAMSFGAGFAGGVLFQGAAGMAGKAASMTGKKAAKTEGGEKAPSAEAPKGELEVKGPVEPVPGEAGLGFKATKDTTFDVVDDTGKSVLPPKTEEPIIEDLDKLAKEAGEEGAGPPAATPDRKKAMAGYIEAMFDDLTKDEITYIRDTTEDPIIKELITERLDTGKIALGEESHPKEAAAAPKAAEPVVAAVKGERPIEIPAGQGDVQNLPRMAALIRDNYLPDLKDEDIRPPSKVTEEQKVVHQLADIWKIKSTFYGADENILPGGINGLADQDNRQIFINEKSAAPDLFVLGHESFHILEKEHPDLWKAAMKVIREEAVNLPQYKALLAKNREAAGTGKEKIDERLVRREFGSDVSGEVFTRPTFWKKLNQRNPEIFKALADIVRRLLLQVKRALKGGTKAHNAVVKNMERVERAIADAYAEAARREQKVATEERTTKVTVPKERRKSNEKTRKQFEAYRDMLGDSEKARELFDELIHMVYTDELMGIGSKRAFFEALAEDHEKPAGEWRTVVMVDLDNFSWFNDALGHLLGDELLAAVGKIMKGLGVDVYRVGGEELAILAADEATATQAVNQMRRELEDRIVIEHTIGTDVELKDGTTYEKGEKITIKGVGISYGIGKTYRAADEELKLDKGFRTAQGIRAAKGAEAKRVSRLPGAAERAAAKKQGKERGKDTLSPEEIEKLSKEAEAEVASWREDMEKQVTEWQTPKLSAKGAFTVKAEKYAEKRGDTGPFHNTWRVYDANGNRLSLIFTSQEAANAYVKKISAVQKKALLSVKSKAFKKWFGKSVVKEDGEPLMVFHGTTSSSVTEFFTGATGRVMEWENFLGPGAYFTSSVDDANENYATDMGPDITSKIEKAKEDYGNLEDYDPDDPRIREVLSDFLKGVTPSPWSDLERTAKEIPEQAGEELDQEFADLDAVLDDEAGLEWVREHYWEEAIDAQVRADLTPDNQGALMPVFLKMVKPLDLSETKLTYTLEYSEDGEDIIGESGPALEMIDEITGLLQQYDANPDSVDRFREGLMEKAMSYEEITGDDILAAMGEAEIYDIYAEDGYSLLSHGAILREAAENLGYDGIIMDAHKYFGPRQLGPAYAPGMKGLFQDTRHYLPFKPNQIKSAIGNVGTYTADNNILLSVKPYDNIEDKKNWSQVGEAAEDLKDLEFTPPAKITDAGVKGLKAMTTVKMTTTGSLKAKNLYAKTPAEAASVLAHIRKSPQENLYTITVDKKGKILEIHRYTKGVSTSANMRATDIVGYVAGVKGATRVYVAHNHPSKTASPSREDIISMSAISGGLDLADIEVVPLIVAGTKWVPVRETPVPIAEQIPGVVRKKKIPIRERTFSLQAAGPKSTNSKEAYKNKVDLFGEKAEGFMLANSQLEAVGFYELPKGESLGATAIGLMRAFERTNANSVFFYGNESLGVANNRELLLMNLRSALGTDLPIHDVFIKDVSLRDTQPNHQIFTGTFDPAVGYSSLKVGGPVFSVKNKEEKPRIRSKHAPKLSVKTKEFKKWFGESKAVDANGKPLVLYHGSESAGFKEFQLASHSKSKGIFFASDRGWAKTYSGSNEDAPLFTGKELFDDPDLVENLEIETSEDKEGSFYSVYVDGDLYYEGSKEEVIADLDNHEFSRPGIYEVYLKMEDPLEVDWQGNSWSEGPTEKVWNVVDEDGDVVETFYEGGEKYRDRMLKENPGYSVEETDQQNWWDVDELIREAEQMGVDGVIVRNISDPGSHAYRDEGGDEYIVFKSAQVKSLYNEKPTESPNILLSAKKKEAALTATPSKGEEGVTRIAYTEGKKKIGTARLLGTTIGDIDVAEKYRKQGYGKKILRDLRDRGGRMLYAVNDASRALAKSAGMLDIGDGRFEFPKNMVAPAAPTFKKWFGDSKVVDEAGNPRVMYHSTTSPEDFGTFERGASDIGIHFGTKEQANDRIKFRSRFMTAKQMEGQRLYPVYLKIENPLRTYDAGAWDPSNVPSALLAAKAITKEEYNELSRWEDEQTQLEVEMEGSGDDLTEALENLQEEFAADVVRLLESKGYDGIVYKNKGEIEGMAEIIFRMDAAKTDAERSAIYKEKAALEESGKTQDSYIVFHPNQIKSVWNRGTFDTAKGNILLSVKRMQMMAEPTDEQIRNMGPDAYMIGQVGDPHLLFSVPERMAAQKWDPINFKDSQYSILNGRIVRELQIFETLFGASEKAIEVPGVGKKPARGIRTYDLMSELFRVIESGEAADIFNRAVDPKKMADARKLSTKSPGKTAQGKRILSPSEEYIRLVEVMRSGALMSSIDEANVKDTLGNNAKAGRSFDLMLALCDPTEQCRFCYAAKSMLRQGTVEKAVRNTFHILMDPIGWAKKAAAEAAAFSRPDLPFIRLQGSGDFTTGPQLKGYNALARYADRPIHIFSRHHEMLRKLVGTPKAPFIKSGSLDATLYDYYGHKYVAANAHKHGIANSWLYTSTKEIETLEKLYSEEALGLILAISPKLHEQLPPHLRVVGCPCDAEERYFVSSCRECALSMFGCMTAFRQKGIDNKGKVWSMADPKRPKTIAPMLAFMKGANAMTVADFIMKKAKETGGDIMKKADKLAFIERTARELGIDPLQVEYSPEVQSYLDVSLTLIDDSIKKTLKQIKAFEAKEKNYAMLYDRRFPGDEIKTESLQVAKDHIDWLRWLRDQALMGKAYLTGGEIQKPIAIKNGEILAAPEMFDKNTAKNLLFSVKTAKGFDPDQVREANATSRPAGVGAGEAKVPKIVKTLAKEGERILDFGAGRKTAEGILPHAESLRKAGMEVDAYEFGENFDAAVHEGNALAKRYDLTYASNVANVQATPSMLKKTLTQMSQTVSRKGGRLVVNMPAAPRKGFLGRMTHAQARELLRRELREIFTDVDAYRDKDGKADREILVASGKRSVALSVKLAADRIKGNENFQKWFEGSDLKNKDGSPMVLYHGTSRDFDQFATLDPKKLLDQIAGFHVATDPRMATDFTGAFAYDPDYDRGPTGGRIMPLFVRGKVQVVDQAKDDRGTIEEDWHAINRTIFQTVFEEDQNRFREFFHSAFRSSVLNGLDKSKLADVVRDALKAKRSLIAALTEAKYNKEVILYLTKGSTKDLGHFAVSWNAQGMTLGFDGRMSLIRKFRKIMTGRGITALQYHNTIEGQKDRRAYVVLDPMAIKSIWNRGTYETTQGNIMLSAKKIEWARTMNQHLEKAWPETATAEHFYQLADTWAKKGAFKTEELEWSGLREWAEGLGKKKVSKAEAMAALLDTQFQIDEVVYHNESPEARQAVINNILDDLESAVYHSRLGDEAKEAFWEEFEDAKIRYLDGNREEMDDFLDYLSDRQELPVDRLVIYESAAESRPSEGMTRHDDYQVEGWSNYHELVMTAPEIGKKEWDLYAAHRQETLKAAREELDRLKKKYGLTHMLTLENVPMDDAREMRRLEYEVHINENAQWGDSDTKIGTFRYEPHWDDLKNPLVHLRFNDRIDADGRKVMFIEELQSDWHEEGREHGYTTGLNVVMRLLDVYPKLPRDPGEWSINKLKEAGVSEEDIDAWHDARMRGSVPDAPFKSTTAWTTLGLKRAVRWAVEHGYDRIAWTPGLIQIERYKHKISQVVDRITVDYSGRKGNVYIHGFKDGNIVFGEEMAVEGETNINGKSYTLEKVIGKEMAGKVRENPEGSHAFSGDELTIGGHGMKVFYDQIMVAAANKLFNKEAFGKAKVGTTKIDHLGRSYRDFLDEGEYVWSHLAPEKVGGGIDKFLERLRQEHPDKNLVLVDDPVNPGYQMILPAHAVVDDKLEVWSLDVTDKMREKAKDLPLFSIKMADVRPARTSVYLRNYLEAVATPEAQKALSLREAGIPFWHEFYDRHAANGRASVKDIKRLYTDLYGPPEKVKIGRHEVMIGNRKAVPMLMVAAYHGSRDFDQFSMEHVGTGEGAQAFGWGLYFTDLKSVAKHYANKIGGRRGTINSVSIGGVEIAKDGKISEKRIFPKSKIATTAMEESIKFQILTVLQKYAQNHDLTKHGIAFDALTEAFDKIEDRYREILDPNSQVARDFGEAYASEKAYAETAMGIVNQLRDDSGSDKKVKITKNKERTIYKVALFKDKDPSEYKFADWQAVPTSDHRLVLDQMAKEGLIDAKMWAEFSEYHKKIDAIMVKHRKATSEYEDMNLDKMQGKKVDETARVKKYEELEAIKREFEDAMDKHPGNLDDFTEYFLKGHAWSTKYGELVRLMGSPREASMLMLRSGIQGIRYPAGSITGGVKPVYKMLIDGKDAKFPKEVIRQLRDAAESSWSPVNKKTTDISPTGPMANRLRNWVTQLKNGVEMHGGGLKVRAEYLEHYERALDAVNAGRLTVEATQPQNYVVFDDSVISIEEKYQFSVKNDPEIRPIAMEYLKMLEATVPPKPAKSAGAAAATTKIAEDLLGQLREEVRVRMKAAEGIPVPKFIDKGKKGILSSWHSFTRSFSELDNRNFGDVTNILRLHREAPDNAVRRAMDVMVNLLDGLDHNQYSAFRMKLIMDDMVRDIESGLLTPDVTKGEMFPFGFADVAEVQAFHKTVTDAVAGDAKVDSAIRRRTRFNKKLKELLVKHNLLDEKVLDDDRYFHHQVLEYRAMTSMGDEYYAGAGLGQQALQYKKKGWQLARKGSLKDYNTDYAQAEYEVIAQAFMQLETKATLERLRKVADFTAKAKAMAKLHESATGEKRDWKEFIPDTHIPWKPMPNSAWYKASTITDRILDKVLSGDMVLGPEHIKEMFVKGRDKEWYIPRELAKTLNEFGNEFNDKFWMAKLSNAMQSRWKAWTLISPLRIIKYNVNNMSGDADITFAYNPLIFKYFPKALKDLSIEKWGEIKDEDLKKELEMAKRLGVIGSGWSVQELTQVTQKLGDVKALKALFETPSLLQKMVGAPKGAAKGYWEGAKNITEVRENILRLAAFRHFLKVIEAGKTVYAASKKSEIDKITDPYEKAAKLSRELVGDYGNISQAGRWLRRHLIPFYSWMEVNAPRYVRLIANVRHEGQGAAGTVARALVGTTARLGLKGTILGAKLAALAVMINLFNHTFFPDEEDELTDDQRRQLHLILGRRKDGSVISLRIQGALSDAMSFFGAEDIASDIRDYRSGRKTMGDLGKEALLATPKKLFGGLRPEVKAVYELLTQKSLYPDPETPRAIRDRWEYVARTFSLNMPYLWLTGRPQRGGDLGAQLINNLMSLGLYSSDPGESAYYNTMAWAHEYLDKMGEDTFAFTPNKKSNYLYWYKQGLKFGDLKAAEKYLKLYAEEGGTPKQMAASVKRAHPLNMIPSKFRAGFQESLSPEQLVTLERAIDWYFKTYQGPNRDAIPFPEPKEREAMTLRKFKLGG